MEKSLEPCDCLGAIYGFASGSSSRQFVRKRKFVRRRATRLAEVLRRVTSAELADGQMLGYVKKYGYDRMHQC
jgi:hypothetical protein